MNKSFWIIIAILIFVRFLKYVADDKVKIWHQMDDLPIASDKNLNIVSVVIISTDDDYGKEVKANFDIEKGRYFDLKGNLITYNFRWCYDL